MKAEDSASPTGRTKTLLVVGVVATATAAATAFALGVLATDPGPDLNEDGVATVEEARQEISSDPGADLDGDGVITFEEAAQEASGHVEPAPGRWVIKAELVSPPRGANDIEEYITKLNTVDTCSELWRHVRNEFDPRDFLYDERRNSDFPNHSINIIRFSVDSGNIDIYFNRQFISEYGSSNIFIWWNGEVKADSIDIFKGRTHARYDGGEFTGEPFDEDEYQIHIQAERVGDCM